MKKIISFCILSIAASLILSTGLVAQEQIEMSVKLTKGGKVVKDTSYLFDNADEAKHAMKMMEIVSGDAPHKEHVTYNYTSTHTGGGEAKTMVFISDDGETTEITEFSGDSNVWVSEEEVDGKKKEIKVVVSGDEEGNWTVVEGDKKVIVIKKSGDVEHDHDCDHDHDKDCDHDEDSDHEENIEYK